MEETNQIEDDIFKNKNEENMLEIKNSLIETKEENEFLKNTLKIQQNENENMQNIIHALKKENKKLIELIKNLQNKNEEKIKFPDDFVKEMKTQTFHNYFQEKEKENVNDDFFNGDNQIQDKESQFNLKYQLFSETWDKKKDLEIEFPDFNIKFSKIYDYNPQILGISAIRNEIFNKKNLDLNFEILKTDTSQGKQINMKKSDLNLVL